MRAQAEYGASLTPKMPPAKKPSSFERQSDRQSGRRIPWIVHGRSLALALALLTVFGPGPTPFAQTPNSEELKAELDVLRENIDSITRRLEAERARRKSEQDALASAERALAGIALELRNTRADLEQARERARELLERAGEIDTAVTARRRTLAEQLRIAYRIGRQSRLKALLNQEDPAEISRVLALHGYLGRARLDAIAALDEELQRLEAVRTEQQQVAARLQLLAERQSAAKAGQDAALAQRQTALDALDDSIRNRSERLIEMQDAATELESLLDELASVLADIPPETEIEPFGDLEGRLPMPVDAPVRATYSDIRSGNVTWQGWLIQTEVGTPVRAVAYGRVAYADWLRGYGMMLIVEHGDGFMTLYGQNQSLIAEIGDWVAPGEVVALAGNTGGNSAPGLYFQIRRDGQPVDPARWVVR